MKRSSVSQGEIDAKEETSLQVIDKLCKYIYAKDVTDRLRTQVRSTHDLELCEIGFDICLLRVPLKWQWQARRTIRQAVKKPHLHLRLEKMMREKSIVHMTLCDT